MRSFTVMVSLTGRIDGVLDDGAVEEEEAAGAVVGAGGGAD